SVHGLTAADYSREQCDAWAPWDMPQAQWSAAMREMRPFEAEFEGMVAGYADLQPDGRIGHFFVAAGHARRGIGTALLRHLMESARRQS
ncbi:GNAT family N-acetyltransferase, partial [Escherichia coli]|uniref:GNAT family N-acetyltransferase n=1 Tax=Escherichia coli TaxID=562 RepID=UPI00215A824D